MLQYFGDVDALTPTWKYKISHNLLCLRFNKQWNIHVGFFARMITILKSVNNSEVISELTVPVFVMLYYLRT